MKYEMLKILDSEGDMRETDLLNHFLGKDPWRARTTLDGLISDGYVKQVERGANKNRVLTLTYNGMSLVWERDELKEMSDKAEKTSQTSIRISIGSVVAAFLSFAALAVDLFFKYFQLF